MNEVKSSATGQATAALAWLRREKWTENDSVKQADLQNVNWENAYIGELDLEKTNLRGANLRNVTHEKTTARIRNIIGGKQSHSSKLIYT